MLVPGLGIKIYLALGDTDMRKSINGLSIIVEEQFDLDPFSGSLFVFCNRSRKTMKILYWDRNGFCLWHKRLEKERFKWPNEEGETMKIEQRELMWLLEGLAIEQKGAHKMLEYRTTY
jgi:transposase